MSGPEPRACFALPHSPWSPPFAPPAPQRPQAALFAGFIATMAGSDFSRPCIIGFGSSPSRCGPSAQTATGRSAGDLPVPVQRACAHARVCDHAGPVGRSHNAPVRVAFRYPNSVGTRNCDFRGSMAGLCVPLSTLHVRPHDRPRMTRGRCGSLLLHRQWTCTTYSLPVSPAHLGYARILRSRTLAPSRPRQPNLVCRNYATRRCRAEDRPNLDREIAS